MALAFAMLLIAPLQGSALSVNPVQKTLQLLTDLASKITAEKDEAAKVFEELTKYCHHESKNFKYEIKTSSEEISDLKAKIEKDTADAAAAEAKISALSSQITKAEEDLKAATGVRETEAADFAKADVELKETINTIERAIGILRSHASMLQSSQVQGLKDALSVMVQASAISAADANKLSAFVQTSSNADDSDVGAPDPTAYAGHSVGIVEALGDLLEKAQGQLSDATQQETEARHNYAMVKQSLEDEIKYSGQDMDKAKAALAASSEAKAVAERDLGMTEKDLKADEEGLESLENDCAAKTEDYNTATASREGELKAIAAAKEVISTKASGAEGLTYDFHQTAAVALLQEGSSAAAKKTAVAEMDDPNFKAVHFVRSLARQQKSQVLALLASRMDSAVQAGSSSGADVFAKVKGLIVDMIERLEKEANADATHKAYCDKELSESNAKKDEKTAEVEKLTTKIDTMSAQSSKLKEEVAELQKELAELATSMAEAEKIRQDEHAAFVKNKPEMEQGIEAVKLALKVLREYYAEESPTAAVGAGEGIIGLLEVVESDFSKNLAEIVAAEEAAATAYDKFKKESEIIKVTKEQDVKYKTKEATDLDKSISETSTDLQGVQAELDAVLQYLSKLEEQCVAKPETYEERVAKRAAEISGLKEALSILENETALVQKSSVRHSLRSVHIHVQ
eukprot:CAMPEP_0178400786 /NCGR_PEP_ID=MMETSP0689_2-20121128/15968_1 /TAXON_ID=160604 /ORGANISM="Amphidinium massartii, Strain CS-259" /LENGTH=686 /DNA_ID=CAMNT_0020021591 /DNA_START=74 /DNA_END=2134 /DNA_ORIENTATION=+